MSRPTVSIIVVNYQRPDDTIRCLDGIADLNWPNDGLEIIVVDNASGDGSAGKIGTAHPDVKVLALRENTGFAGGCNRGAAAAAGRFLAFLNNDARPDPNWLQAAVQVLGRARGPACVASKVLDWEGRTLDFVDAGLSFSGQGFKLHVGEEDVAAESESDVLFASGAAMVIDAEVFHEVGGFDDRYFMFFEDVDLGWRLWLLGYHVRYVPSSIVYHHHHGSMGDVAPWREHFLLERNALFTIFKNYDDEHLARFLAPALALTIRRGVALGGDDSTQLEMTRRPIGDESPSLEVHKQTAAATFAVDAFVEALPELSDARAKVQAMRRRPDREIMRLFRSPLQPEIQLPTFLTAFEAVRGAFRIDEAFSSRRRILVVTGDTLRPKMAGPAIRAWQIALALSKEHEVQLVSTVDCQGLSHRDFVVRQVSSRELKRLEQWCDVCIFQGYVMYEQSALRKSSKVMVVDIYDPFHLEQLEQGRDLGEDRRRAVVESSTQVLNQQLARGDFFLCASEKQRDFWLGQLAAMGRINPANYDADETLRRLIDVAPFGVDDHEPVHTRQVLKGVHPGIGPDDKVILWGGGIYNWFDPLTLIRAIDKLRVRVPEVRLFFLGLKHPNPYVPEMRMATAARVLAEELGLSGTHVFFNEGWVEYADRQNYLLEADIGVSTHLDHVETEFSFRTRLLDYFWASLPIVATGGDSFADLIDNRGLGVSVPPDDVDALEAALFRLLTDDEYREACQDRIRTVSQDFKWSRLLEPLLQFCRDPLRAPDFTEVEGEATSALMPTGRAATPLPRWRRDLNIVRRYLRRGDVASIARKSVGRVRRRLAIRRR